jgi:serine phosphatase RsbU (regulator of sigma subunit)
VFNAGGTVIARFVFAVMLCSVLGAQVGSANGKLFETSMIDGKGAAMLAPYLLYSTDDDPAFADVNADVSAWKQVPTGLREGRTVVLDDWTGTGWFRLRMKVSDLHRSTALSLRVFMMGGCEIYVDGERLATVGDVEGSYSVLPSNRIFTLDPVLDRSDTEREHVIAIRVRTPKYRYLMNDGDAVAFYAMIAETDEVYRYALDYRTEILKTLLIPFGMVIALGVLHLLMWLFDRSATVNLFYVAFALTYSAIFVSWLVTMTTTTPSWMSAFEQIQPFLWSLIVALVLLLISMIYYGRVSGQRLILTSSAFLLSISLPFFIDDIGTTLWGVFVCAAAIDVGRLTFRAVRMRQEGAWVVGLGLLVFSLYLLYWFFGFYLQVIPIVPALWDVIFPAGLVALPLSMSVFLARRVSTTNSSLQEQLQRVEELTAIKMVREREVIEQEMRRQALEAENKRKTAELDEARKLQFSMLPTSMPETVNLKASIAMNTATEVGGDYVDYYLHAPDHVTFAVGDATGHGLKAGVMVATTKSHFQTHAIGNSHDEILSKTSDGIRRLRLRGLYMCLGLLTVQGRQAIWSAAGIPPLLHYRASTGWVEQRLLKALPLGVPRHGEVQSLSFDVEDGDVLVALTDGLPELFNAEHQSLGYGPIERTLRDTGHRTPHEIVDALIDLADRWRSSQPYNDDVTLLVIKIGS